jgi:hypothetical protein
MALPLAGMFCYVCVAPATIPQRNEVELNGKDLRGKGPCLVGPSPTIILRPNQVVLAAKQRADATAWKLSFAAGDALLMALQAGDEIYMTRGGTGDFDLYVERLGRRGFPGRPSVSPFRERTPWASRSQPCARQFYWRIRASISSSGSSSGIARTGANVRLSKCSVGAMAHGSLTDATVLVSPRSEYRGGCLA